MIDSYVCPHCRSDQQIVRVVVYRKAKRKGGRSRPATVEWMEQVPCPDCTPTGRTIATNIGRKDEWLDIEPDGSLTYQTDRERRQITVRELVSDHPALATLALSKLLAGVSR